MATKKQPQGGEGAREPRKARPEASPEGIDGPGHHLRDESEDDFYDAERDSCTVTRKRDDLISDS